MAQDWCHTSASLALGHLHHGEGGALRIYKPCKSAYWHIHRLARDGATGGARGLDCGVAIGHREADAPVRWHLCGEVLGRHLHHPADRVAVDLPDRVAVGGALEAGLAQPPTEDLAVERARAV